MAQACNNIGKDLTLVPKQLSSSSSSSSEVSSKIPKSNSPTLEIKKSSKRTASRTYLSSSAKKTTFSADYHLPSSSFMFDSLIYYNLNKALSLSTVDLPLLATLPMYYSALSSSFQPSSYFADSVLTSPFICNWMNSSKLDGCCGKLFTKDIHLLEHLCTEHTSLPSVEPNSSCYSSTSVEQLKPK